MSGRSGNEVYWNGDIWWWMRQCDDWVMKRKSERKNDDMKTCAYCANSEVHSRTVRRDLLVLPLLQRYHPPPLSHRFVQGHAGDSRNWRWWICVGITIPPERKLSISCHRTGRFARPIESVGQARRMSSSSTTSYLMDSQIDFAIRALHIMISFCIHYMCGLLHRLSIYIYTDNL